METCWALLARKVIWQALLDCSRTDKKLGEENINKKIRSDARQFLCGKTKAWENSLRDWCEVAGFRADNIMKKAREWDKTGYPTLKEFRKEFKRLGIKFE